MIKTDNVVILREVSPSSSSFDPMERRNTAGTQDVNDH